MVEASSQQMELGEGDWLRIAEHAYRTYWAHRIATERTGKGGVLRGVEWIYLEPTQKAAWVVAVKAVFELADQTELR